MERRKGKVKKENDKNAMNVDTCCKHTYTPKEVDQFRCLLLPWFDRTCRVMPWREAARPSSSSYIADPNVRGYSCLVSEVMLQQTQVATVVEYYTRWMAKWPTVEHLAASTLEEVQEAWSGLGYYSRGRRLREAAVTVSEKLKGEMPRTAEQLEKLPGVGRYTAAAVASIAYQQVTGLVDGNVIRVLARMRRIGAAVEAKETVGALWEISSQLVDRERPGDFNQAMMELGAVVCTPKNPSCAACPVSSLCGAKISTGSLEVEECGLCLPKKERSLEQGVMQWPRKKVRKEAVAKVTLVAVVSKGATWAMCRRPKEGLLANMLEFPSITLEEKEEQDSESVRKRRLEEKMDQLGIVKLGKLTLAGKLPHVFSHIHMTYVVYTVDAVKEESEPENDAEKDNSVPVVQWLTREELATCGTSTGMRKVFNLATGSGQSSKGSVSVKRKRVEDSGTLKQKSISSFFSTKSVKKE